MMPGEIPVGVRAVEKAWIELQERAGEPALLDTLEINLGWDDDQYAERQWQKNALQAIEYKDRSAAVLLGEHDRAASDQEDERHAPAIDEAHQLLQARPMLGVLDVPIPIHVGHSRVIED